MRHQGKVKKIKDKKSGFITPENGDKDIYFVADQVKEGMDSLKPGYLVSFSINTRENNFIFANEIELVYKNGKVKKIEVQKGGSIDSDDGEKYSFIAKEVKGDGITFLKEGDSVEFSIGIGRYNKKYANQVRKLEIQEISASDGVSKNSGIPTCSEIKNGAIAEFEKIQEITDPYEFEDAVFLLLKALGINSLYQYDPRKLQAGKPDGFFTIGYLAAIYDCTLRQKFEEHKGQQIDNFVGCLEKSEVSVEVRSPTGKTTPKMVKVARHKQVWIITKGKTRVIKDVNNIKVKEVAVVDLIQLLKMRFDVDVMEENDLAKKLEAIDE